jgi:hypothetical protein
MKTKITCCFLIAISISVYLPAQFPGFNYQAVLRDAQGIPMPETSLTLFVSLTAGPDGNILYEESHDLITNELGLLNTMIGAGNISSGTFANIIGVADLHVKIEAQLPDEPTRIEIGSSAIGAVPYALYGEDADADPQNEIQQLSLEGDSLKISGSKGISLETVKSPLQKIEGGYELSLMDESRTLSETQAVRMTSQGGLSLKNANWNQYLTPNGSSIEDGTNQIRVCNGILGTLLSNEKLLEIAQHTGIALSTLAMSIGEVTTGPDLVIAQFQTSLGEGAYYREYGNTVYVTKQIDDECSQSWSIGGERQAKHFRKGDNVGSEIYCNDKFALGWAKTQGAAGRSQATFGGTFSTANDDGLTALTGRIPGADPGFAVQYLFNGQNLGVASSINAESAGTSTTYGANGMRNTVAGTFSGDNNGGAIITFDQNGETGAYLWTRNDGSSQVGADQFIMTTQAPGRANEAAYFSVPVGGEAAAYDRGTAQLVNGEATVSCPDYFGWVADDQSMTVSITPLSADSKGIAVIEKSATGFKVKELNGGSGNYSFDYLVICKRKGFEDYKVVRPKPVLLDDENQELLKKLPKGPLQSVLDLTSNIDH